MVNGFEARELNLLEPEKTIGNESVGVGFSGLSVRIEGLNDDLKTRLTERYEGYSENEDRVLSTLKVYYGKDCFIKPDEEGMLKIEEKENEDGTFILSQDFSGFINREKSEGFALLNGDKETRFLVLAIENFVMRVLSHLALEKGGFFLHSCGMVKDNKSYIFYGPSGSGKSAIATLSPELGILSDDLVLIIPEEGKYYASSTPFWGAIARTMRIKGIFEIAGVYKLVKSSETEIKKIDTIKALTTMFASSFMGSLSQKKILILFENIKTFLKSQEVYELKLPLQPLFWDLISK
jgi:hypothetical protein